jgi:NhaP-type Na+/H+ or K+/H+ antiporter
MDTEGIPGTIPEVGIERKTPSPEVPEVECVVESATTEPVKKSGTIDELKKTTEALTKTAEEVNSSKSGTPELKTSSTRGPTSGSCTSMMLQVPDAHGHGSHLPVPHNGHGHPQTDSLLSHVGNETDILHSRPSILSFYDEIHMPEVTANEALIEAIGHASIAIMIYLSAMLVWKKDYFVPWDPGFACVMLWAGSMVLGNAFKLAGCPQLLGMLCAGIILKNCIRRTENGIEESIVDLPENVSATIRAFGLVNILMRGGLEMDLKAVKRIGMSVVWLTVVPGVAEALSVAGLAVIIFEMPFFLALAFGFTLAAVSPAIVVGGMFELQANGYGVKKGIPTFVVAAASFDDVVAISGFSMFIGLATGGGDSNVALLVLGGPINIFLGFFCGALGGYILSWTRVWNTDYKRSLVLVLFAVIIKFGFKNIKIDGLELDGAGALAALVMACVAAQSWEHGWGGKLSAGPDGHAAHAAEGLLCLLWKIISEPLLFSVIGSALDFSTMKGSTIPKACILLFGCVAVRTAMAMIATQTAGLNMKERAFVALAWMPKASVQAALGAVPLAKIMEEKKDESDFADWEAWGTDILTTAVFSIILTAPLGLLVIQHLGPRWLEQEPGEDTIVKGS